MASTSSRIIGEIDVVAFGDVALRDSPLRHAPHTVFTDLASHLAPESVILVCDDVLLRDPATAHEHALPRCWQRGWRLSHVASVQSFFDAAASTGFTPLHQRDLTLWLRLYR